MNYPYMMTGIAIMALVTYLPRMIPLIFMRHKIKNRFIRSFFSYVPYAVLAAMTFPDILFSTSSIISATVGLSIGLLLAWKNCGLVMVALGAAGAVFLTECLVTLFL